MPQHFTRMNADFHPTEKLYPEITLFFVHEPTWHDFHEIGVHFLCEGQRYNHIPGNQYLNFKDKAANSVQKYAEKVYGYRKDCFDPWKFMPYTVDLSDFYKCKDFFRKISNEITEEIQ